MLTRRRSFPRQRGFTLIEVLVSIMILSLGVLALVKLQANAARLATDARQRAEATFLVDQLLARMLISDPATASSFAHNPNGSVRCSPEQAPSTNPAVTEWLQQVIATFPNATSQAQQVAVSGSDVTVRLCWKNGEQDAVHSLELTDRVQWP